MKGIIFDLDGVIIHTDHFHYLAWKKMCDQFRLSFDKELNNQLRGVSRSESLEIILNYNQAKFSEEQKTLMTHIKNDFYKEFLSNLSDDDLDDDVKKVLYELKSRAYKLAIGSSSRNAKFILKNIGLYDIFDTISDGTNIEKSKPDPEVFIKAAQGLGLKNESCIVVEDAIAGLEAAKTCGMTTIGYGDAKDSELSDHKLKKFSDLINLIGSI